VGIKKQYVRTVADAGSNSKLQQLASADTATAVLNYGVTTINSDSTSGTNSFTMDDPIHGGTHKYIAVTLGTTDSVVLASASTTVTFFGSTNATVTFSTGAGEKHLGLVSVSATEWAVVSQSTGVTFSA
jgi:hypothetical protein